MPELYMPGAATSLQSGGVTLDKSLPPRAVWHITWDALKADGTQPEFSAVSNYLKNQGYCPNIMWNPFTGFIEQYYPGNVGGRALTQWNQDGAANIQIEIFFSPGCVYKGKKYMTVAETPLVNFDKILAWLDTYDIPRVWPMGEPQWQGNARDVGIWNNKAGHYGHCHVPNNTHTDPGPMPDISFKSVEEMIMALTDADAAKVAAAMLNMRAFDPTKEFPKPPTVSEFYRAQHYAMFNNNKTNESIIGKESLPGLVNQTGLNIIEVVKQVGTKVDNIDRKIGGTK